MKKILLTLFILIITATYGLCDTTSYNKYGSKVATYKTNGSTTTSYNKYGQKTGCDFCKYKSICMFNTNMNDYLYI